MKEFIDYYKILGVSEEATEVEIKSAYRKKVMELRPDIKLDEQTRIEFEKLQKAKDILIDPITRISYKLNYDINILLDFEKFASEKMAKAKEQYEANANYCQKK